MVLGIAGTPPAQLLGAAPQPPPHTTKSEEEDEDMNSFCTAISSMDHQPQWFGAQIGDQ